MYERFYELMKEKGLTAYKVSADTGISQSTLSDWKNGKITPKIDKLITLAAYFDVDVEYITGQSNVRKYKMSQEEINELRKQGDIYLDEKVKDALSTITSALNNRTKLTLREERLLSSFSLLSGDMQDSFLAMLESTVKNIQQKP